MGRRWGCLGKGNISVWKIYKQLQSKCKCKRLKTTEKYFWLKFSQERTFCCLFHVVFHIVFHSSEISV